MNSGESHAWSRTVLPLHVLQISLPHCSSAKPCALIRPCCFHISMLSKNSSSWLKSPVMKRNPVLDSTISLVSCWSNMFDASMALGHVGPLGQRYTFAPVICLGPHQKRAICTLPRLCSWLSHRQCIGLGMRSVMNEGYSCPLSKCLFLHFWPIGLLVHHAVGVDLGLLVHDVVCGCTAWSLPWWGVFRYIPIYQVVVLRKSIPSVVVLLDLLFQSTRVLDCWPLQFGWWVLGLVLLRSGFPKIKDSQEIPNSTNDCLWTPEKTM